MKKLKEHIFRVMICLAAAACVPGAAGYAAELPRTQTITQTVSELKGANGADTDTEDTDAAREAIRELIDSINVMDPNEPEKEISNHDDPAFADLTFGDYGSYGSLLIPEADISVALEFVPGSADDETAQGTVDAENTAAWMPMGNAILVADHVTQEFGKLYDVEVGDIAYVDDFKGYITAYRCTRVEFGTNETDHIADANGHDITEDDVYVMYTCTDNSYNILLTFWEPLNRSK